MQIAPLLRFRLTAKQMVFAWKLPMSSSGATLHLNERFKRATHLD